MNNHKKIVVILGQTASGKSALAMDVAQEYNGEIIAADSRTIYRNMDIGTAKPSLDDQLAVMHHGLNLVDPDQSFSAAEFKDYTSRVINDINNRGKLPIIVGGTGLYIDSYVYDFSFTSQPSKELRQELNALNMLQLQQRAKDVGIAEGSVDFANPHHLGRAIERTMAGQTAQQRAPKPNTILLIGLKPDREQLIQRITERVDTMFTAGLIEEVQRVVDEYGRDAPALRAPGYKAVIEYIDGNISLEQSKELFVRNDKRLAKRQLTWFKRNPDIIWCETPGDGIKNIRAFLQ